MKTRGSGAVGALVAWLLMATPAGAEGTRYLDLVYLWSDIEKTHQNVEYGESANHSTDPDYIALHGASVKLLLDVYQPREDDAVWRPAIVWVHGGYFKRGKKEDYQSTIEQWARAGYVVFAINYRLRPELPEGLTPGLFLDQRLHEYIDTIVDAQHDAQAAIRWVRANAGTYRVDPARVAIVGHSAGGLTATAVAFNWEDAGSSNTLGTPSKPDAAVAMAGGGAPVLEIHIDPGDVPIQFVHGLMDDVVPPAPAILPPCALTLAMGNSCELVLDPDQGHSPFGYAEVRDYLYRQIVAPPGLRLPTRVTVVP